MSDVSEIYDHLFSYEAKGKLRAYPIHKRLNLNGKYQDLVDLIISETTFNKTDKVLDVGCGTGYSLIKLGEQKKVSGLGISISNKEIEFAQYQIKSTYLEQSLKFRNMDFNASLGEVYDKIIAIESLKHSQNTSKTLDNLMSSLNKKGVLIIADDFIRGDKSAVNEKHKKYWKVPGFGLLDTLIEYFKVENMEVRQIDLTSSVPLRSSLKLNMMIIFIEFLLRICPLKYKVNLKTFVGGLFLEKLYNQGKVGYHLIFAKKI